jgi:surfactin synthase thioesterase subunit
MTTVEPTVLAHVAGPDEPDVDVVVFPGAGAGPSSVAGWEPVLPTGWRLSAICLPGRGIRFGEPFETDPLAVAESAAAAIERRCSAPTVLIGHSLGALWAQLAAFTVRPALLASAGCEPAVIGEPLAMPEFTEEDDRQFMRELLLSLGVTDDETLVELTEISVPVLRADIDMARGWRAPDRVLDCPIVSYYGTEEGLRALPWTVHTTASADVVTVPGDHYFFQNSAAEVVADLARRLETICRTW